MESSYAPSNHWPQVLKCSWLADLFSTIHQTCNGINEVQLFICAKSGSAHPFSMNSLYISASPSCQLQPLYTSNETWAQECTCAHPKHGGWHQCPEDIPLQKLLSFLMRGDEILWSPNEMKNLVGLNNSNKDWQPPLHPHEFVRQTLGGLSRTALCARVCSLWGACVGRARDDNRTSTLVEKSCHETNYKLQSKKVRQKRDLEAQSTREIPKQLWLQMRKSDVSGSIQERLPKEAVCCTAIGWGVG